MSNPEINALLNESRVFPPTAQWREHAVAADAGVYEYAARDPESFWSAFAAELEWMQPWTRVLDWQPPYARWFVGGRINASVNCLDRHPPRAATRPRSSGKANRRWTHADLPRFAARCVSSPTCCGPKSAKAIASRSICRSFRVGDRHAAWPESARFWRDVRRVQRRRAARSHQRRGASVLVTADGGFRRGHLVPEADGGRGAERTRRRSHVVVVQRASVGRSGGRSDRSTACPAAARSLSRADGRSPASCPQEPMDSEDMLYILYTSGTTGKRGITRRRPFSAAALKWVFDFTTTMCIGAADIGWVTATAPSVRSTAERRPC